MYFLTYSFKLGENMSAHKNQLSGYSRSGWKAMGGEEEREKEEERKSVLTMASYTCNWTPNFCDSPTNPNQPKFHKLWNFVFIAWK